MSYIKINKMVVCQDCGCTNVVAKEIIRIKLQDGTKIKLCRKCAKALSCDLCDTLMNEGLWDE